ncbi:BZ3500_MvSof-1268-A1-R1_Chr2-2g05069 [Microbotryum saponariae]|uniref:BZ3500_MvSof-1268-A1-R1_Chr2-2g05069 protein n=1 Tax=Microbotryum saponariae TaxID=289078 RepID=A0A2X0N6I0_9BASI|nr:BZ3500_MvSof-1268-A1-R1_Chr2-2g05069 [Microbotryum saponariae]SDA00836.1 BZ3501_MvSof-1269-A2-R1_Chr2-2g04743 [Microbotryum saponariae]
MIFGAVALFMLYGLWSYRDGRAIGTSPLSSGTTYTKGRAFPCSETVSMPSGIQVRSRIEEEINSEALELIFTETRAQAPSATERKHITFTMPGVRMIELSRPNFIEHIQRTHFKNHGKGPTFYNNVKQVLGTLDNKAVDDHRNVVPRCARVFGRDIDSVSSRPAARPQGNAFRDIISQSLEKNLSTLSKILSKKAETGEVWASALHRTGTPLATGAEINPLLAAFELLSLFFRFTLNSFSDMAFGSAINALSTETDEPVPFAVAFDEAQGVMNGRFVKAIPKGSTSEPRLVHSGVSPSYGTAWRMRKAVRTIDDFSYKLIDERTKNGLNDVNPGENRNKSETDLLSLYMSIRDDQGKALSRKQLRDAIIAGRDTTGQACSWSMYRLIRHPEVVKKMSAEVDEMGSIDYDSYKTMKQTNAASNEALRLLKGPCDRSKEWRDQDEVWRDQKAECRKEEEAGRRDWSVLALEGRLTSCSGIDYYTQLRPPLEGGDFRRGWTTWGEDFSANLSFSNLWQALGDDLIPDGPYIKAGDFLECLEFGRVLFCAAIRFDYQISLSSYHVFNGGSRLCLGQDLARYESAALLATILRDFDFDFAPSYSEVQMLPTEDVPRYASSLTLPMLEPLMVVAMPHKRSTQ